ncbi:FUSC family protein [Ancylobacter sp. 6x-1]|uniref:FUSC family protein n=2 Tax=Ancylobacter crimeensis TaxID=2579147 RepID=A0ABT0DD66_9HYPH|nr:FUSC family protein [Ancylobacter crimeensis]
MLALYIALAFDLPRPYWAMAAVYIVSNPLAGATSSKALYRALGTVIGATAAVILVPLLVNAPELLTLVVGLWTGTLLYISLLHRTPRSYVFMLAGYSLPLIALPVIGSPETIFDTAVARSEEIILGITCAAVVGTVVFPQSISSALAERLSAVLNDAAAWADEILRGEGALPATPLRRQKLASDIASLDLIISQLSYDAGARDAERHARELRSRLLMLLPLFSSLADRLHALKDMDGALSPDLHGTLNDVADWLARGDRSDVATASALVARVEALQPHDSNDWDSMILSSALERLREIVELWQDCVELRTAVAAGRAAANWRPAFRKRRLVASAQHHDHALLVFSAGTVVLGIIVATAFWIVTGWSAGSGFVMMAAVGGSFFAGLDQPTPRIRTMFLVTTASVIVSGIYLFGILPRVHDFEMLVLVFAPAFLLLGLVMLKPQLNMHALLIAVNTASFVALENRYSASFADFVNGGLAASAGVGFALAWSMVTRPFGAELAARRLLRAGWADFAEIAAGRKLRDPEKLAGRVLDRLGQLVPRLSALPDRELAKVDGYAEVRIGFNIIELQKARGKLAPGAAAMLDDVLAAVADFYRERLAQGLSVEPKESLRAEIDRALARISAEGPHARIAADALVGLRRVFFPDSPGPSGTYVPQDTGPLLMAAE